jgi:hypothetical protein
MTYLSKIKSALSIRRNVVASTLIVVTIATVFAGLPQIKDKALADTCPNPVAQATLNHFPITYNDNGEDCRDYPALDARLANGGVYSQSASDHANGLTAQENDEIYVLSYIHNGAANNLGDTNIAKNVRIQTNVPSTSGTQHTITTQFRGDNTNTVSGNFTVYTQAGMKLEVVANSGQLVDYTGSNVLRSGFDVTDGETIGDLRACFEYSVFVRFKVRVVKTTVIIPPTTTVTNQAICINNVLIHATNFAAGQPFSATVTVRNTGTSTWTSSGNYRLGSQAPQDNTYWGNSRMTLPRSNIAPGEDVSFIISSTVPTAPGNYPFAWKMVQDGNAGFFGATCSITINVPTPQQPPQVTVINNNQNNNQNTLINTNQNGNGNTASSGSNQGSNQQTTVGGNNAVCAQVITRAYNPNTGEVRDFPTRCNVPSGWVIMGNGSTGTGSQGTTVSGTGSSVSNNQNGNQNGLSNTNQNGSGNSASTNIGQSSNQGISVSGNGTTVTASNNQNNNQNALSNTNQNNTGSGTGTVAGSNVNLVFSKKAQNDSRNANAETVTAMRDDFITYTLTVTNTGNSAVNNFVITDDLSGVLPFADVVDNGGGTVSGNSITYAAVSIPAGSSVSKTFRVRVKSFLSPSLSYVMRNTYGNTVTINIGSVQGAATFVAPTTGAAETSAAVFAGLLTTGFVLFRKRQALMKLIFT